MDPRVREDDGAAAADYLRSIWLISFIRQLRRFRRFNRGDPLMSCALGIAVHVFQASAVASGQPAT